MTDHKPNSSAAISGGPASDASKSMDSVAAEDLDCLRAALADWERERAALLARTQAVEAESHGKLQHLELRLQRALGELDASKRTATAARVRFEADLQSAQASAQLAQQTLAASQQVSEQLRVANVELSTAMDAAQWRLTELEAENATLRDCVLRLEQDHDADRQRLADFESVLLVEQARTRSANDNVESLTASLRAAVADFDAACIHRGKLEEQLAAAELDRIQVESQHQVERARFEQALQELRSTHAGERHAWENHTTELTTAREAFARRVQSLEEGLRQRDASIEQMRSEMAELDAKHVRTLRVADELVRRTTDESNAAMQTLRDELETLRRALAAAEASRMVAQQRGRDVEALSEQRAGQLNELRKQIEGAAALQQQNAQARADLEQRAANLDAQRVALTQRLADEQKQSALTHHRCEGLTARIAELESQRGSFNLRVDELTALTTQLERECDRLRRDRGSSEETRRLKADNARLEAKIVELDRQRADAVQRHSAAVAGYMVELNQRSEALHAREVEVQKLTEELGLVKQSCEDAVGELVAQRHQHEALERELATLRAAPARPTGSTVAVPGRSVVPTPLRPDTPAAVEHVSPARSAKRPTQSDTIGGPVTVIHLEESKAFCEAAREVVARLPDARYMNAPDATAADAAGSRLLVVNLLSRTHDPIAALTSFIAADTYHRNVLAYCAEGNNGFSFGTADFFSQPVDPDACLARLLESRGAIQRLLVVTENFAVVGAMRHVLSRMRSSVSAALELRQVFDLLPMVEPDVVLIDLDLPRGEGLRVVSRLRSDAKTQHLPLGILLAPPGNASEFRQHILRAARALPMTAAHLAEAVKQRLGAPLAASTAAHSVTSASAIA